MTAEWLLVEDVAEKLRCSKRFVYDELRRKRLRGSNTKAGWRIDPADLETYMESQMNVPAVRKRTA